MCSSVNFLVTCDRNWLAGRIAAAAPHRNLLRRRKRGRGWRKGRRRREATVTRERASKPTKRLWRTSKWQCGLCLHHPWISTCCWGDRRWGSLLDSGFQGAQRGGALWSLQECSHSRRGCHGLAALRSSLYHQWCNAGQPESAQIHDRSEAGHQSHGKGAEDGGSSSWFWNIRASAQTGTAEGRKIRRRGENTNSGSAHSIVQHRHKVRKCSTAVTGPPTQHHRDPQQASTTSNSRRSVVSESLYSSSDHTNAAQHHTARTHTPLTFIRSAQARPPAGSQALLSAQELTTWTQTCQGESESITKRWYINTKI